jgi:hypothetical protein
MIKGVSEHHKRHGGKKKSRKGAKKIAKKK